MQRNLGFTPGRVLGSLFQLRFIAILAQLAVIAFAETVLDMRLPLTAMLSLIAGLGLWNLLIGWRLQPRILDRWAATALETSVHLAVDIAVLTSLLYWAGGPTNPFVSLYLVPIAIAAVALPTLHAWLMTALCVAAYSLLLWQHVPLPHVHGGHDGTDFNLHVIGMWANFILSALLIAGFVSLLATAVRRRDQALTRQREETLRNEQILALGTQAAGTAHELNTPLSTMAILVRELQISRADDSDLKSDLDILATQLTHCRDRITELVEQVSAVKGSQRQTAQSVIGDVLERWSLLRPETHIDLHMDPSLAEACVLADPTLAQALINLLNNAADASAESGNDQIHLQATIDGKHLRINIDDEGPGLTASEQARAGEAFFTTKTGGLGIGLVLSNATIERLGGQITLENRNVAGTRASVTLPLLD